MLDNSGFEEYFDYFPHNYPTEWFNQNAEVIRGQ